MPIVSVVLPVRDGASYVALAVKSILRQTFRDIELIVVDDGSADATPQILAQAARSDPRLRILSQRPSGIAAALEHGRAVADAPYFARMDGDDIAVADRLERQIRYLEANPEVVAVGGQIDVIDGKGRKLRRGRYPVQPAECRRFLRFGAPLAHPAVTMRKAALDRVGGYRAQFAPAEDVDLWLRLARDGELANLEEVVLEYRAYRSGSADYPMAQARANALALVESETGSVPGAATALIPAELGDTWNRIESALPSGQRLFARMAYLRALALNGGIRDASPLSLLLSSLNDLAREAKATGTTDTLAFAWTRSAYQLAGAGHYEAVLRLLAATLVRFPLVTLRELLSSVAAFRRHAIVNRSRAMKQLFGV